MRSTMREVGVYNAEGVEVDRVRLPSRVFDIEPNEHVLYEAVKAYLTNQRQGNASVRNRSEARGGGRKPWPQKGIGLARAGSIRSPIWVGGGRAHGPRPKNYRYSIPKKVKRLAIRSAFSLKARRDEIVVVDGVCFNEPKTKRMVAILQALNLSAKRVLFLVDIPDDNLLKSCHNIPGLEVRLATGMSAYELLNSEVLLISKGALSKIEGAFAS